MLSDVCDAALTRIRNVGPHIYGLRVHARRKLMH